MTLKAVATADRRFQAASGKAESLRQERNNLIRAAVAEGVSMSEIARALGCSRARIAQIVEQV